VLRFLFTPVHKTIRMTPLTCFTTLICCFVGCYFTWTNDDVLFGMMKAVFVALLIGLGNLGVHELYEKLRTKHETPQRHS